MQSVVEPSPVEDMEDAAPEEIEDIADGDLSAVKAKMFEACKLVLHACLAGHPPKAHEFAYALDSCSTDRSQDGTRRCFY